MTLRSQTGARLSDYRSWQGGGHMSLPIRRSSILAVLALLVAAACAPAATPGASVSSSPQPTAGGAAGTLVLDADVGGLISLDPGVAYEFSGVLLAPNVFET